MNNFQKLQQIQEEQFGEKQEQKIRRNLNATFSSFRFVGDIVDVFIPKFVDMLLVFTGGKPLDSMKKDPGSSVDNIVDSSRGSHDNTDRF